MEYLYIYFEENTVGQLYYEGIGDERIYVYSDGYDYEIRFNVDSEINKYNFERLEKGAKHVRLTSECGGDYEVYASPLSAFGL